jgi:hypothetical protein
LIVAVAARSRGIRLVGLGIAATATLYVLGHLRFHTLVVAAFALLLTSWVGDKPGRLARVAGGVVIAVTVPWILGLGPLGITFVLNSGDIAQRRLLNAQGADSAVVDDDGDSNGFPQPGSGSVEQPDYDDPDPPLDPGLEHLPRGITVMLFEPVPWSSSDSLSFRLAQAESVVWYPILLLGAIGLWSVHRHLRLLLFPVLAGGGVLFTYALAEGNIGTAYRHRGEFVWIVVLLAAFGVDQLRRRRRSRRASQQGTPA